MLRWLNRRLIASLSRVFARAVNSPLPLFRLPALFGQAQAIGTCTVRGVPLAMAIEDYCDYAVFKSWATAEAATLDWIDSFEPGNVFLDIGASTGRFALYAAARLRGRLQVTALEPDGRAAWRLARNVTLNDLAQQVTPVVIAAGERDGLVPLGFNYDSPQGHVDGRGIPDGMPAFSYFVQAASVDQLVGARIIAQPAYIKVDVDGDELSVLHGSRETLAASACRAVLVEVSADTKPGVVGFLAEFGYRVGGVERFTHATLENLIFVRSASAPARPFAEHDALAQARVRAAVGRTELHEDER